jgi:hypothetical protein
MRERQTMKAVGERILSGELTPPASDPAGSVPE